MFLKNRGWENRTPTKGFGDPYHTIWPIPYMKYRNFKTTYMLTFNWIIRPCLCSIHGHLMTPSFGVICPQMSRPVCKHPSVSELTLVCFLPVLTAFSLFGQALTLLVAVSSIRYRTSTPALSTSSSSRGFTPFGWDISSWGGLHA